MFKYFFRMPTREYFFIFFAGLVFLFSFFIQGFSFHFVVFFFALMGILTVFVPAFSVLLEWNFSIDILYFLALLSLFIKGEMSAVIIISIILSLGRIFDFNINRIKKTNKNFSNKIPKTVLRQDRNVYEEVSIDKVKNGDIILVKEKEIIPVDGVVVFGEAKVKENPVTGISMLIKKILNEKVFSGSFVDSGSVKIRAICTSEESVLSKKTRIIKESEEKVPYLQEISRRINEYFFPVVFILGIGVYLMTNNIIMFSALFLVVCHRILTVFIPFHYKKVFAIVVKQGIILKNGEKFEMLGKTKIIILDKTDASTFSSFQIEKVHIEEGLSKTDFWKSVAIVEKYSDDPVNKTLFREAVNQIQIVPDAQKYQVYNGSGVYAQYGRDNIVIGSKKLLLELKTKFPRGFQKNLSEENENTTVFVAINSVFVGAITLTNVPEKNIRANIEELHKIGVEKIVLFTNSNDEEKSQNMANAFCVDNFFSLSIFEEKKSEIERLSKMGFVTVISDGKWDYLKNSGVNIAMGKYCSAISNDNSDIIVLNDDLGLLSKLILSSRNLVKIIYRDIIIWFLINFLGILLVLFGFIPPFSAILYSFVVEIVYLLFLQEKTK